MGAVDFDVIVAGAGPAGAGAALGAVRAGLRVLVVEAQKLPRHKCCSGILFSHGEQVIQDLYGTLPTHLFHTPYKTALVQFEDGGEFRYCPFGIQEGIAPDKPLHHAWRRDLDYWLVEKSGAEIWDRSALAALQDKGDHVVAVVRRGGQEYRFRTRYVVGADGGFSRVRKTVDPAFDAAVRYHVSAQHYFDDWSFDLDEDIFWAFAVPQLQGYHAGVSKKGEWLCLCVHARSLHAQTAMGLLTDFLKTRFKLKVGKLRHTEGARFNTLSRSGRFHHGVGRVLLAGEAGGFTYLNLDGITSGLQTGAAAAAAIAASLQSGQPALARYEQLTQPVRAAAAKSWQFTG